MAHQKICKICKLDITLEEELDFAFIANHNKNHIIEYLKRYVPKKEFETITNWDFINSGNPKIRRIKHDRTS